jgi:hypothetical protein
LIFRFRRINSPLLLIFPLAVEHPSLVLNPMRHFGPLLAKRLMTPPYPFRLFPQIAWMTRC